MKQKIKITFKNNKEAVLCEKITHYENAGKTNLNFFDKVDSEHKYNLETIDNIDEIVLETVEITNTLEELCNEIIKIIQKEHNPHTTIIINSQNAELLYGKKVII